MRLLLQIQYRSVNPPAFTLCILARRTCVSSSGRRIHLSPLRLRSSLIRNYTLIVTVSLSLSRESSPHSSATSQQLRINYAAYSYRVLQQSVLHPSFVHLVRRRRSAQSTSAGRSSFASSFLSLLSNSPRVCQNCRLLVYVFVFIALIVGVHCSCRKSSYICTSRFTISCICI